MSGDLPFPISFQLPDGWAAVSPEACGQPEAAYAALRTLNARDPVPTSVVVSGFAAHRATLDIAALSNAYLTGLQTRYPVTVLKRDATATGADPQAAQLLKIDYPAGESTVAVNQIHMLLAFADTTNPETAAVLQLIMTCPSTIFAHAGPEFSRFVATIAPQ